MTNPCPIFSPEALRWLGVAILIIAALVYELISHRHKKIQNDGLYRAFRSTEELKGILQKNGYHDFFSNRRNGK